MKNLEVFSRTIGPEKLRFYIKGYRDGAESISLKSWFVGVTLGHSWKNHFWPDCTKYIQLIE
jgi:hypothetical protein